MSINGVSNSPYSAKYQPRTETKPKTENSAATEDAAATYESSSAQSAPTTYKQNIDLVNQLKADAEARTSQLRSLVEKMIANQGQAFGKANDMWSFIASGNYTVDAETKAQAQKDIAEDGYWGVKQTSERILSFAKALTGGDPSKAEDMRAAFEKGYKAATKAWGKELPGISKDTYDSVMKQFDDWAAEGKTAESQTK